MTDKTFIINHIPQSDELEMVEQCSKIDDINCYHISNNRIKNLENDLKTIYKFILDDTKDDEKLTLDEVKTSMSNITDMLEEIKNCDTHLTYEKDYSSFIEEPV